MALQMECSGGPIGGLIGLCKVYQVARVPLTRFRCNLGPASCHEFNISQMKRARKQFEDVSDFFSAEVHHLHGSLCKTIELMLAVCTAAVQCNHTHDQPIGDVKFRILVIMHQSEMGWNSASLSYTSVSDLHCIPFSPSFTLSLYKAGEHWLYP